MSRLVWESDEPEKVYLPAEDRPSPVRTWVCDGCMKTVTAEQIADFADYEHVLCKECT